VHFTLIYINNDVNTSSLCNIDILQPYMISQLILMDFLLMIMQLILFQKNLYHPSAKGYLMFS